MLTAEENELICRTGPNTPMGDLFRRYWLPALLSDEVPEVDGPPVRARLMSENLVAFRDSEGNVGLVEEACPHRGASMFFGINDRGGLMCIYHGFKFDVTGKCLETPSAMPGSTLKEKVRIKAYPTIESAGIVWAYLGPPEKKPIFRRLDVSMAPGSHVSATKTPVYCNYLQSLEGNIDTSHSATLHRSYGDRKPWVDDGTDQPGHPSPALDKYVRAHSRHSRVEVQDTPYGFRAINTRMTPAGNQYIRISNHVLPTFTLIGGHPIAPGKVQRGGWIFMIPIDDENCWRYQVNLADEPVPPERNRQFYEQMMDPANPRRRKLRLDNDYEIDRDAQKTKFVAGIQGIPNQDYAVTESMGPIYDRTKEYLYEEDAAIIRCRQILIRSARAVASGEDAPCNSPEVPWDKIRSEDIIIGPEEDPWTLAADAGETAARGQRLY